MKPILIAVHDYQHGSVGMLVRSDSADKLKNLLGNSWQVIDQNVEDYACYQQAMANGDHIYDMDEPEGLLATMILLAKWQSEGKTGYPIIAERAGRAGCREVWARSKEELERMFPGCRYLYGTSIGQPLGKSDMDVVDEFIKDFGSNV
ncbi:hypothetical protein ACVBEJ_09755 [Porticoccus sp. GXU_MW_L64]